MHSFIGRWSASAEHPGAFPAICGPLRIAGVVGGLLLAGCTTTDGSNTTGSLLDNLNLLPTSAPTAPAESEKGACDTPAECKSVLTTMINNPDRGWVGQPQSPHAYANGTRLFAYRALRKKLSCGELTQAVNEMHAASKVMSGPVPGVAPDQVSRTRALSAQVEGELIKERAGRCRSG